MYKFQPILKSTIWGGEKIVPYKHIASDQKQVGESWELSGVKGNDRRAFLCPQLRCIRSC